MIGIVISTFNRPEYLSQCFESIKMAEIPNDTLIVIVDDKSTDKETLKLIKEFNVPNCEVVKITNKKNSSIKFSLQVGFEYCFNKECKYVMNLDGDAIVNNLFVIQLINLKKLFPKHIVTGFNCNTKNNDGSSRHKVLEDFGSCNFKKSVGGINMLLEKEQYDIYIKPVLINCLKNGGNWDHKSCLKSFNDGYAVVCCAPSVVQHIGISSAMGHTVSEQPDTADDFKPLTLTNVTLIGVDCVDLDRLIKAADICCENINFQSVKLLSSLYSLDERVSYIEPICSTDSYSNFVLKQINNYIDTPYFLLFQHDGFVLNYKSWKKEFLNYDYIGAVWRWLKGKHKVGNGGFSLRSKKLHKILQKDDTIILKKDQSGNTPCDYNICKIYRTYLEEKYNINFAPEKLAEQFSIEAYKSKDNKYTDQFGFHGYNVILPKGYKI